MWGNLRLTPRRSPAPALSLMGCTLTPDPPLWEVLRPEPSAPPGGVRHGRPDPPARPPPTASSLVLPAYNEEAGIAQAVTEAEDALRFLADHPATPITAYEILVVDDGSRDDYGRRGRACTGRNATRPAAAAAPEPTAGCRAASAAPASRRHSMIPSPSPTPTVQFFLADLAPPVAPDQRIAGVAVGWREQRPGLASAAASCRGGTTCWRDGPAGYRGSRRATAPLKVFRRDALAAVAARVARGFFVNAEMLTRARLQGQRGGRGRGPAPAARARG